MAVGPPPGRHHHAVWRCAFALVVLGGCQFDTALPSGIRVSCTENADCPVGTVCRESLGRCIRADNDDTEPPHFVTGPIVEPAVGRAGTRFALSFTTSESLDHDPAVHVERGSELRG